MPDEIMFPEDLSTGRNLPPEMLRDLRVIAAVETVVIDKLTRALQLETGVLTGERVEELTHQFFDDDTAESVARTLRIVRPESKKVILALVDRWRQVSEERRQTLTNDEFAALQENLDSLVQDYPGLALMRKAQRLLRDTGNEIDDAIFICDLRPVFDDPQEQIEGFVALANLRIRYTHQSGDPDVFEIALTEDELSTFIKQGQKALNKLNVLKETVHVLIE